MSFEHTCKSNIYGSILWLFLICFSSSLATDLYGENWGVTRINVDKVNYLWTITNYSLNNLNSGQVLESPIFRGDDSDKHQWQLSLYPKGRNNRNSVALFLYSRINHKVTADCKFYIIDGNGKKTNLNAYTYKFTNSKSGWGWESFIAQSTLKDKSRNLLPNDSLSVLVEMSVTLEGTTNISGHCKFYNFTSTVNKDNTGRFLDNNLLSDVQLRTKDGQLIKAHRAILATHSSWFFKKFSENPNLNIVDLANLTTKDTKEALRFMYEGKIEIVESSAKSLFGLSNQLGIAGLKLISEELLCRSMKPVNATEIMMFARLHGAKNLEREASNYIAANANNVVDSYDFQAMETSFPNPFYGVLRTLINKKKT